MGGVYRESAALCKCVWLTIVPYIKYSVRSGLLQGLGHGRDENGRKRKNSNGGSNSRKKVLVFTSTKVRAEELCMALQQARIAADRIHADRAQKLRDGALEAFARLGSGKILVATDVAARGINVMDVSVVVNYDLPLARGCVLIRCVWNSLAI